jgi:hypothetical protein
VTPDDIELHRVMLSDCCPWPSSRISLICNALTTVSHGRGHRFKPCTAHHIIKHLRVILQLYSFGFGTASRTRPKGADPSGQLQRMTTVIRTPAPAWIRSELRRNFARASLAGRRAARQEPRAASARYLSRIRTLEIGLTSGVTLKIPIQLILELKHSSPRDIRAVEVLGRGGGLHWERLDVDLSVPRLVASVLRLELTADRDSQ